MLHRRTLLTVLAAAGLVPGVGRAADAAPTTAHQALGKLFDRMVQQQLHRSPELATSLGLDRGALVALKSRLSDASLAASAEDKRVAEANLAALKAIPRAGLSGIDAANYDTVLFVLQVAVDGDRAFDYAGGGLASPYVLSQLVGSYHDVPDFLDTQHDIKTCGRCGSVSGAAGCAGGGDGAGAGAGAP